MAIGDGRVISNFITQAILNKHITIYGDGEQTRSFQYIDDLINAMILAMNSNDKFIGPVNIGNPNEISINELAQKIIKLTNSKSKLIYKKSPSDDPKRRKPDIKLANEILNWKPDISLEFGLTHSIDYYKNLLQN